MIEFNMSPIGKGESLSPYVSKILDVIDSSGVTYRLTPMGTILEGKWDEVMSVVKNCFENMKQDCSRIGMNLKMDYREGNESRLEKKIKSIENKLSKDLKK